MIEAVLCFDNGMIAALFRWQRDVICPSAMVPAKRERANHSAPSPPALPCNVDPLLQCETAVHAQKPTAHPAEVARSEPDCPRDLSSHRPCLLYGRQTWWPGWGGFPAPQSVCTPRRRRHGKMGSRLEDASGWQQDAGAGTVAAV